MYKSDVFAIGMIILELVSMDHPKFYYNADKMEINFSRVKYNLASLKGEFSLEFQNLLFRCLEEDPQLRYDFRQASAYVDKVRNKLSVAGCIKLVDEEGDTKKKPKKIAESESHFRNLPKTLEQKLMVIPITSYADKKTEPSRLIDAKTKVQRETTSSSTWSGWNKQRF